jgi:hypothetical protein
VTHAADELRRRAHDALHASVSSNRAAQVLHPGDIGGVVGKAGPVDVRDGRKMRDGVRPNRVDRALYGVGIQEVAGMMLDAVCRRLRNTRVQAEDGVSAPREELGQMKPDETRISRDENSQRRLRYFAIRNGPMRCANIVDTKSPEAWYESAAALAVERGRVSASRAFCARFARLSWPMAT